MGVNSLPKTVTRQRRGCDLNPDPSAPESSTLTTRLPSQPNFCIIVKLSQDCHRCFVNRAPVCQNKEAPSPSHATEVTPIFGDV